MIKYLPLLFLVACNTETERKEPVYINTGISDSLHLAIDSLKTDLQSIKQISDYAKEAEAKIAQLENEKRQLEAEREKEVSYTVSEFRSDDRDRKIAELTKRLFQYENEIAGLKKKLNEEKISKVDKVPEPVIHEPEKPTGNSLVVVLDRKMKDGSEIPLDGIDVYIIPYSKKVKGLLRYEINCDLTKLTEATQAGFYAGQYFFNDLRPGKYLIKICTYFGGYKVIEKENNYQSIAMQVSPPIQ
jgi:predicted RNase H-like nuclease (RuvC/YqgF family)